MQGIEKCVVWRGMEGFRRNEKKKHRSAAAKLNALLKNFNMRYLHTEKHSIEIVYGILFKSCVKRVFVKCHLLYQ